MSCHLITPQNNSVEYATAYAALANNPAVSSPNLFPSSVGPVLSNGPVVCLNGPNQAFSTCTDYSKLGNLGPWIAVGYQQSGLDAPVYFISNTSPDDVLQRCNQTVYPPR